MTIERIMSRNVVTVTPQQSLRDAIELMRSRRIRHIPVVDGANLVGIVTDRDVKRASPSILSAVVREEFERVLDETKIGMIMTREPVAASPAMPVKQALALLLEHRVGALPVVDGTVLIGIVTDTDMLRAFHATLSD